MRKSVQITHSHVVYSPVFALKKGPRIVYSYLLTEQIAKNYSETSGGACITGNQWFVAMHALSIACLSRTFTIRTPKRLDKIFLV